MVLAVKCAQLKMASSPNFSCMVCHKAITAATDRYAVDGKGKFNVRSFLLSIEFKGDFCSDLACKGCIEKLKRIDGFRRKFNEAFSELERHGNACPLKDPDSSLGKH